jgi:hypothetical protein
MKSFCLLTCTFLLVSLNTNGQSEVRPEPFSIFIDAGPALQQTNTGGAVIEFNPGYTFAYGYRAGVQFAWAGFDEHTVASYILTLDYYYFQNRRFRLSVGAGYGLYTNSFYSSPASLPPEEKLVYQNTGRMGGNIRLGLEWNHLSFRVAWHRAPNLYKYEYNTYYPPGISIFKGSYLALSIGIRIRGGYK